jgi:hypothetical protein
MQINIDVRGKDYIISNLVSDIHPVVTKPRMLTRLNMKHSLEKQKIICSSLKLAERQHILGKQVVWM